MPSGIADHSTRVIAIQIGFWTTVLALGAIAVGCQRFVTSAAAAFGATVLASAAVLELTER